MAERTLAELLVGHPDQEPIAPFPALLDAQSVTVQAVLERTAITHPPDFPTERRVVRLGLLYVNPELVQWRGETGSRLSDNGAPFVRGRQAFANFQTAPKTPQDRAERRRAGDERALKNRAELAAKPKPPTVRVVAAKRAPNRTPEAKQRAKITAQRKRREGAPKFCRSCRQEKPRSAFPATRGSPSCLVCRERTHCVKGHEMTPENTILRKRWRGCRICINEEQRRYRLTNPAPREELNPERHRRYYVEHRDAIRARKRRTYQRKKEAAA